MFTSNQLRKRFLKYFEGRDHRILPSASLVPVDDASLLWNSAGMVPFKKYFAGLATPPHSRIATSQKCLRTPDIEEVGRTARHHTFFEMLGNFSFGDYFKTDAIVWAWEFLTQDIGLEKDKLWITIYEDDDEAYDIWKNRAGVPGERIVRMGRDTNFWEIGLGACGPCSEIHYDQGEKVGCGQLDCSVKCECDRYLEVWNLVFAQYDQKADGTYEPLPKKNIDTGMGLERLAAVVQGVHSNFDTDLFQPIIKKASEIGGIQYGQDSQKDLALRIIADHVRAITFALSDGVLPSNEGRGYIIRRLLRRAARYGRVLGINQEYLHEVAVAVRDKMGDAYPEIDQNFNRISRVIENEERRFRETLEQGTEVFEKMASKAIQSGINKLSGKDVFMLYDTYGLPMEVTREMAEEQDLKIDECSFNELMEEQRERARKARKDDSGWDEEGTYIEIRDAIGKSEFYGYDLAEVKTRIIAILEDGSAKEKVKEGEETEIVLEKTPFYAEAGGQVCDKGIIFNDGNRMEVNYTGRPVEGVTIHKAKVLKGSFYVGNEVVAKIDSKKRAATQCNHTATHLLHKALREILGEHVKQSGSMVSPDRLRFDFSQFEALTGDEIKSIEDKVNSKIFDNLEVTTIETTFEKAKEMDVIALFDEKYGETVRIVKIGDYTTELCGGTHVLNTGEIGCFKIISESAIAAGIRRIEAVTRWDVLEFFEQQEEVLKKSSDILNTSPMDLPVKIEKTLSQIKELKSQIDKLKKMQASKGVDQLIDNAQYIDSVPVVIGELDGLDASSLREMGDMLKNKIKSGIVVLSSKLGNDKVLFVSIVTEDLVKKGLHAGNIVKQAAKVAGGGGGGRPDMAQAGGKFPEKVDEAIASAKEFIKNVLS